MITKLDIQEKDGFLTMKDFPMNCIFNKVKTGCGATTIALTNNENYIIAVPTTELAPLFRCDEPFGIPERIENAYRCISLSGKIIQRQ